MIEECWIIYGYKKPKYLYGAMIYESTGSPSSVDFNWEKIFQEHKKIIGFVHTHPMGFLGPSTIDDKTMAGWVKALGRPMLCGIKHGKKMNMYIYERTEPETPAISCREIPFAKIGKFLRVKVS